MMFLEMFLVRFMRDCKGATAIEYGLIAAGISLAVSISIYAFGDTLNNLFFTRLPEVLGSP